MVPIELFYCYARKDLVLRDELHAHLAGLRRSGLITTWYDGEISPGTLWEQEIDTHLHNAHVILLLISSDFLASDYCYSKEMTQALERHARKDACVIPILLRPVDWTNAPFQALQMLPSNGQPVTKWLNRDQAFENVAQGTRRVVEEFTAKRYPDSTSFRDEHIAEQRIPQEEKNHHQQEMDGNIGVSTAMNRSDQLTVFSQSGRPPSSFAAQGLQVLSVPSFFQEGTSSHTFQPNKAWSLEWSSIDAPPLILGQRLYLCAEQMIYALDLHTGTNLWAFSPEMPSTVRTLLPTVDNTCLCLMGFDDTILYDDTIALFNAQTGKEYWKHKIAGTRLRLSHHALTDNDRIYIGLNPKDKRMRSNAAPFLCALESKTGQQFWPQYDFGIIEAPLVRSDGCIYALINRVTFECRYLSYAPPGSFGISSMGAYAETMINQNCGPWYIMQPVGHSVMAIDEISGNVRWSLPKDNELSPFLQVDKESVYVVSKNTLQALDKYTGRERWRFSVTGKISSLSGSAYPFIYLSTNNDFQVINVQTREKIANLPLDNDRSYKVKGKFIYEEVARNLQRSKSGTSTLSIRDAFTGKELWKEHLKLQGHLLFEPTWNDDFICITTTTRAFTKNKCVVEVFRLHE